MDRESINYGSFNVGFITNFQANWVNKKKTFEISSWINLESYLWRFLNQKKIYF